MRELRKRQNLAATPTYSPSLPNRRAHRPSCRRHWRLTHEAPKSWTRRPLMTIPACHYFRRRRARRWVHNAFLWHVRRQSECIVKCVSKRVHDFPFQTGASPSDHLHFVCFSGIGVQATVVVKYMETTLPTLYQCGESSSIYLKVKAWKLESSRDKILKT